MEEKKADRRVRYTKMKLKEALVSLLQQQHISKVSIKALCDLADVNRSTFYAHYRDQYDLLEQISGEVLDNLQMYLHENEHDETVPVSEPMLKKILDYAGQNVELFKALLGDNSDVSFLSECMKIAMVLDAPAEYAQAENVKDYLLLFSISGCVSVIQKWLTTGMRESSAFMSELLLRTLYSGLRGDGDQSMPTA